MSSQSPVSEQAGAALANLPSDVAFGLSIRWDGRRIAARQPDLVLRTASVGKLLLLIATAVAARDGRVMLDERLSKPSDERVGDSGVWQHLRTGSLPLADVALLAGSLSDNLATNVLLERLGIAAVRDCERALGLHATSLLDRVREPRTGQHPFTLSVGTADELAKLMDRLHGDSLPWPRVGAQVLAWLEHDADLSMVASAFALDPLSHHDPDRGLLLRHKTGTDHGIRADVGVLSGPRGTLTYAAIANWSASSDNRRDVVLEVMHDLGRVLRRAVES